MVAWLAALVVFAPRRPDELSTYEQATHPVLHAPAFCLGGVRSTVADERAARAYRALLPLRPAFAGLHSLRLLSAAWGARVASRPC